MAYGCKRIRFYEIIPQIIEARHMVAIMIIIKFI